MSKEKGSWMRRMLRACDLPEDPDGSVLRCTLTGRRDLVIENHKGVCAYSDTLVILAGAEGAVSVSGSGLELTELDGERVLIRGSVDTLKYGEPN